MRAYISKVNDILQEHATMSQNIILSYPCDFLTEFQIIGTHHIHVYILKIQSSDHRSTDLKHITSKYSEAVAQGFWGIIPPWKALALLVQFLFYGFKIHTISNYYKNNLTIRAMLSLKMWYSLSTHQVQHKHLTNTKSISLHYKGIYHIKTSKMIFF